MRKRKNSREPNPHSTHYILGGVAAAAAGAAISVGGALLSGRGAKGATETSARGSAENLARLERAGANADELFSGSAAQADRLLSEGYTGAERRLAPYDYLGTQGSNALARYLGIPREDTEPAFERAPYSPAPSSYQGIQLPGWVDPSFFAQNYENAKAAYRARWGTAGPGVDAASLFPQSRRDQTGQAAYDAETAKLRSAYDAAAAKRKAQIEADKTVSDYGDYFKPFTRENLYADPLYETELDEGVRAWDLGAAGRGNLMSGTTVAGLRELTAAGIERARGRDIDARNRKYGAYSGLTEMGLGIRKDLASAGLSTAGARANALLSSTANRANSLYNFANAGADYNQRAADARASGQLAQSTSYRNAANTLAELGILYGAGVFKET